MLKSPLGYNIYSSLLRIGQYVPPKCGQLSNRLHGHIVEKIIFTSRNGHIKEKKLCGDVGFKYGLLSGREK
jgi:hypothetical protein